MRAVIGKANSDCAIVHVPSSKSLSHRYLIVSALADGTSRIRNLAHNSDIDATINALRKCGVCIDTDGDTTAVKGVGGIIDYDGSVVDCNESGSTLRFMLPIIALSDKEVIFTGKGKLMERPLSVYEDFYDIDKESESIKVRGIIMPGEYHIRGDVSSQFISGLLFVLPMLNNDSKLIIDEAFESKSYVILTIEALNKAGVEIVMNDNEIYVKGNQKYNPVDIEIDGDDSQAVFFGCEALIADKKITIDNLNSDSLQGDHVFIKHLQDAGGVVSNDNSFERGLLKPFEADLKDCPDLGPMLFGLAGCIDGTCVFHNTKRLRLKESDRIESMKMELEKIGCKVIEYDNKVEITGNKYTGDVCFDSHNDHRIAMALSIVGLNVDGEVVIDNCEAVNKSYPKFYEDLEKTGVEVRLYD